MLKVSDINVFYGKVQALFDVSIEVGENEIVSVIGANGAGKTTLMKSIIGINKTQTGGIEFNGKDITNQKPHISIYDGIVYVPEGREVFPEMSVEVNLEMGAFSKKYSQSQMQEHKEEVYQLFPRLKERAKQKAGTLSGGEQQMLAIGRGMMSDPALILFDEPSLGLAPVIVDEMFDAIVEINKRKNTPVIIVEQNAFMAMSISNRTYVLENGKVSHKGLSSELLESPEIKKAYLGG
ncbi:MAG: ABC transporter ATP-binding protein [Lachnospiraceae bacterium]|nr:ABC transporter ATP-binding protein [Lachnospiraceae bacterium]